MSMHSKLDDAEIRAQLALLAGQITGPHQDTEHLLFVGNSIRHLKVLQLKLWVEAYGTAE